MTPLERAARAIANDLARQEPEKGGTYFVDAADICAAVIDGTFDLSSITRAVITAIREPSEGMINRAYNHMEANGNDPRFAWEAMIDAILEEG